MKRSALLLLAAGVLTACDGLQQAMTAHVDVVARAGSQELEVDRLAALIGNAPPQLPVNREFAKAVSDLWTDYMLLGQAAANGDTLLDPSLIESAMWADIANARAGKVYEAVSKRWTPPDTLGSEAEYRRGDLLAAQHILLVVPEGAPPAVRDSVRRQAEALRARATPANFAQLATANSQDSQSARRGGYLGVFPRGAMVPAFEQAVVALQPGEISPVVESQYGYHIVRRAPFEDARGEFAEQAQVRYRQVAESTYMAKLEESSRVEVKSGIAQTVRDVARDVEGNFDNDAVLAETRHGDFTAGKLARWIAAFPRQAQIRQRIESQPDSALPNVVRGVLRNELILAQADSAGIKLDSTEVTQLHAAYRNMVLSAWAGLNISPDTLRALAATPAERERIAAERIDAYLTQLVTNNARFVEVPTPLHVALLEEYEPKFYPAGLDRAVQQAQSVRALADSARATQPQSQVPLPGAGQGQPQGQPQGRPAPQPQRP